MNPAEFGIAVFGVLVFGSFTIAYLQHKVGL